MYNFTFYFTVCDKKLKTTIKAWTEEEAEKILRSKFDIIKVEKELPTDNDILNFLFNGKRN